MSKTFDSGVAAYVTGSATVKNHFPVSAKGGADVCCEQCRFFLRQSSMCALNKMICSYPKNYVGADCPLEMEAI